MTLSCFSLSLSERFPNPCSRQDCWCCSYGVGGAIAGHSHVFLNNRQGVIHAPSPPVENLSLLPWPVGLFNVFRSSGTSRSTLVGSKSTTRQVTGCQSSSTERPSCTRSIRSIYMLCEEGSIMWTASKRGQACAAQPIRLHCAVSYDLFAVAEVCFGAVTSKQHRVQKWHAKCLTVSVFFEQPVRCF